MKEKKETGAVFSTIVDASVKTFHAGSEER